MTSFGNNGQLSIESTDPLLNHQRPASGFFELGVAEPPAELKPASVVLHNQHPAAGLARQAYQRVLRPAMAANVRQSFADDAGNLATRGRWQVHLRRITNELSANSGVLPVASDHAREKLDQMPRVKLQRLQLVDQVANIGGFGLHQLLRSEEHTS